MVGWVGRGGRRWSHQGQLQLVRGLWTEATAVEACVGVRVSQDREKRVGETSQAEKLPWEGLESKESLDHSESRVKFYVAGGEGMVGGELKDSGVANRDSGSGLYAGGRETKHTPWAAPLFAPRLSSAQ